MSRNILLIGGGGREHAMASSFIRSPQLAKLYIAPGNAGTAELGTNVDINTQSFDDIHSFCIDHDIEIIVVGPEQLLVEGIFDFFKDKNIQVVGPSKSGAELEGSKSFANAFMSRHNIPTASSKNFNSSNRNEARNYILSHPVPIVLKADGLAAGKGVLIIDDREEAANALEEMLDGKFGAASETVVVEQFLDGIEFSVFILTDGKEYLLLPEAKDYKRIGEGDTGLNTGGMGSISPVPFYNDELKQKVITQIIEPTLAGISAESIVYNGFIFFGLILVDDEPYVIEYNCRMGDPESESVFPRVQNDWLEIFDALKNGGLNNQNIKINPSYCATVFAVSGGYPEAYAKGVEMTIPTHLEKDQHLFHAGTKVLQEKLVTNGGRVMACSSLGATMEEALESSYTLMNKVQFEGKYFRKDIGFDI